MKKLIVLMLGLTISGIAAAQATALNPGKNNYKMTDCSLLANDIVLTLSNNVLGAVNCNADEAFISVAACHTTGLVSNRSAVVTKNADGSTKCTVTETEKCVETVTGSSYPAASTKDGTVQPVFPGQACAAGSVSSVATSFNPPPDEGDE